MAHPDFDCIRDEYRDVIMRIFSNTDGAARRRTLHGMYYFLDARTGDFQYRHIFHDGNEGIPPLYEDDNYMAADKGKKKWDAIEVWPPLTESDYQIYADGTPTGSPEGRKRNEANAREIKHRAFLKKAPTKDWSWELGRPDPGWTHHT